MSKSNQNGLIWFDCSSHFIITVVGCRFCPFCLLEISIWLAWAPVSNLTDLCSSFICLSFLPFIRSFLCHLHEVLLNSCVFKVLWAVFSNGTMLIGLGFMSIIHMGQASSNFHGGCMNVLFSTRFYWVYYNGRRESLGPPVPVPTPDETQGCVRKRSCVQTTFVNQWKADSPPPPEYAKGEQTSSKTGQGCTWTPSAHQQSGRTG